MNKQKQHINTNNADAFKRYLDGLMQAAEAHQFERDLLNDTFESDALDGLASLNRKTIETDLETLRSKIDQRKSSRWLRPVIYAAASIAITIGILTSLWQIQPEQLPTVSDHMEIHPTPKVEEEKLPEEPAEASMPTPTSHGYTSVTTTNSTLKQETTIRKEASKPVAHKQMAAPLKRNVEFNIADSEALSIEVPQQNVAVSRLESEMMNVDYGTLEGVSLQGMSSKHSDQKLSIKGRITDRNLHPIPGASVKVEGTSLATIANPDGSFEMEIPAKDSSKSLRVNFVGFIAQESQILSNDSINFVLNEETYALSEVVTISSSDSSDRLINEDFDAQPIVGMEAYIAELEKNLRYPANGTGKKEQVIVLISINNKGEIKNIEIKRSPGESFSVETIRAIRNGSKWQPATNKGFPVDDTIKLKLNFQPN